MPKRSYPFEDNYYPQRKIFVTEKIVNCGVAQEERMPIVYERTRKYLFNGANKKTPKNETLDYFDNFKATPDEIVELCVDCGKPCPMYKPIGEMALKGTCFVCSCPSQNKCNYCEKLICSNCENCCSHCGFIFCQNCIFIVFTGKMDDGGVCLSCFK